MFGSGSGSSKKTTVLLVDDDAAIRTKLRSFLEGAGYVVREAADGLVALGLLRAMPPAIVVLGNHSMPRLDVPGFIDFVQKDPRLATTHVYCYLPASNRLLSPTLTRQLRALKVTVIHKPCPVESLLARLAEAGTRLGQVAESH